MTSETERTAETEPHEADDTDLRVDLWVRRPVCGPQTTVIDRLGRLRATGRLADFSVTTWPEEIVLTGASRQADLLETIERFESWAADHGLSLRPPFETRTASLLVGDSEDVLRTPMLLAVAREGESITGIYPCTDGTETWTVSAFLDELAAGSEGQRPKPADGTAGPLSEQGTS
jgi:hypothetical protein